MKLTLFIACCLLDLALGAPNKAKTVDELRPAYQKNILPYEDDSSRVMKGSDAKRDQFPYQVSLTWTYLEEGPNHICGGSIIGETVVLTAAHCIQTYGTFAIEAGILNRGEITDWKESRAVEQIIGHPEWPGGSDVGPYDLAVVIFSSPLTWTQSIQPIALPKAGKSFSGIGIVSGWGGSASSPAFSTTLQWAEKDLITNIECASDLIGIMGNSKLLEDTMICTSGALGLSICGGDSGGPLAHDGTLIGVVSWGFAPCGMINNAPSVYTRTASFIEWINQYI